MRFFAGGAYLIIFMTAVQFPVAPYTPQEQERPPVPKRFSASAGVHFSGFSADGLAQRNGSDNMCTFLSALVAQLDRVSGFEPVGCRFESCRARHFSCPVSFRHLSSTSLLACRLLAGHYITRDNPHSPSRQGLPMSTVAILGASNNPDRYSHKAQLLLNEYGHTPLPVSLHDEQVLGTPAVRRLSDITDEVDTLTVYINPRHLREVAAQIEALKP